VCSLTTYTIATCKAPEAQMCSPLGDTQRHRVAPVLVFAAALAVLAVVSGCAAEQDGAPAPDQQSVETPDPAAQRALEQTALEVAEAFADRDRGAVERTEAWLPQLRGDYEVAEGVQVSRGEAADDGLVLLTHAATDTYKCIAVTAAADVAGEPVAIARMSIGQPRC
jgi:hypothetical protein